MEKVKVLHLELDAHMGGIESFLYNLYRAIDKERVQFDFVTRANTPAREDELRKLGANIYKVSSYRHPLKYMEDLDKIICQGDYNVIHIHKNSAAIVLPFFVTRKHKNVAVFVHSHNTKPSIGGIASVLHNLNKGVLYKSADEHFACSSAAGKWMFGTKQFVVVKNGIIAKDFIYNERIRKEYRDKLNIAYNSIVLGHVGRFTEQKNHKALIDIFYEIQKIRQDSVLLLIGDGENVPEIKNKVYNYGITDKVFFLGNKSDVANWLMCMDAFVMPSLYEGLPISAVEAQATGAETFLSDTISRETQLTDSVVWFSNDADKKILAQRILSVISSKKDRSKYNYDVIAAGFDMEETAKTMLDYYSKYAAI